VEKKSKFINTNIQVKCSKCNQIGKFVIRVRFKKGFECYIYHGNWPTIIKHSVSCKDYDEYFKKYIDLFYKS